VYLVHLAIRAIPHHLNEFKYSSWILQWGRGVCGIKHCLL